MYLLKFTGNSDAFVGTMIDTKHLNEKIKKVSGIIDTEDNIVIINGNIYNIRRLTTNFILMDK